MARELPDQFDIISDTDAHEKKYYGIEILDGTFPNDTTSVEANQVGVNLSDLNGIKTGMLYGRFNKITLASGTIIAYY